MTEAVELNALDGSEQRRAVEIFGIATNFFEVSFVLCDGRLLGGFLDHTHNGIAKTVMPVEERPLALFEATGAIRFRRGSGGVVNVEFSRIPTELQVRALKDSMGRGVILLEINCVKPGAFLTRSDNRGALMEVINHPTTRDLATFVTRAVRAIRMGDQYV